MARSFDGAGDNLLTANNALPTLDAQLQSFGVWFVAANTSSMMFTTMTADGAGNFIYILKIFTPTVSGCRLLWSVNATPDGNWLTDDLTMNVPHHFVVTYDRGSLLNVPVFWLDGVSVTVNVSTSPAVGILTAGDTLKLGENAGGGEDFSGKQGWMAVAAGELWDAAAVNRARWWGRPHGGLVAYYPLVTTVLTNEGSASAPLTATGTTVATMVTPVVRPGSAMMGMGIGW